MVSDTDPVIEEFYGPSNLKIYVKSIFYKRYRRLLRISGRFPHAQLRFTTKTLINSQFQANKTLKDEKEILNKVRDAGTALKFLYSAYYNPKSVERSLVKAISRVEGEMIRRNRSKPDVSITINNGFFLDYS